MEVSTELKVQKKQTKIACPAWPGKTNCTLDWHPPASENIVGDPDVC